MLIEANQIEKSFGTGEARRTVLSGVSLSLAPGETLALTGESGSGKSTLLNILGALEPADGGDLRIAGTDLAGLGDTARARLRRDRIGLVFQQFNLVPSLTVAGNLSLQARLAGRQDTEWERHLAGRLGLTDHLTRYPDQLSGGQQQRVAIGRALASRPALVLADEPTGNLDEETADRVMTLLTDLAAESGSGLVMATHSERHAARLARRAHLTLGQLR
ncbi:ABC transporter ATP-binding protein [Tropicimonas sp. IMCC34011]|uniref:ABC transporter ATP-binding protein n=1 Tax=Tropicimonas sp. IMCC34011 TaxID=2248759 RepID=UPI000E260B34|nr:ABC transporter ATP-binding protein [Tropicimonas sp. IMCC34011]